MTKKISLEPQLKIASLKSENEELTKKNEKLTNTLKLKSQQLLSYFLRLHGAHVLITKLRKQIPDKDSIYNRKFSLKDTFSGSIFSKNKSILSLNIGRTTQFMAEARFMQHTCMLSFQKASLAIDLCFNLFFGCNPPTQFVPSPSTLAIWNNTLGEVDKINLRTLFAASQYDFHLWADDPNKGGNERHVVGVHTWNSEVRSVKGTF